MGPFTTEEPYLAVVRGGQVGWFKMASGAPQVVTEMQFTVRTALATGAMRDISLVMNTDVLELLVEKAQTALALAKEYQDAGPPGDHGEPGKQGA